MLEAREGSSFFSQFNGDNDNEVDMITFLHSGYAGEMPGVGGNDKICTLDHLHGIIALDTNFHMDSN